MSFPALEPGIESRLADALAAAPPGGVRPRLTRADRVRVAVAFAMIPALIWLARDAEPLVHDLVLWILLVPVGMAALRGGIWPGLAAMALAALAAWYWILPPLRTLQVADPFLRDRFVAFVLVSFFFAVVAGNARRSRARALAALAEARHSAAVIDTFLLSSPTGLAVLDRNLRYVRINPALAAISGLPVEAHIGRSVAELLPGLAEILGPHLRRVLETGTPLLNFEVVGETPAAPGQRCTWLANLYPVRRPDGDIVGIGASVVEITERKRLEDALSQSEARYSTLMSATKSFVWRVDPAGKPLGDPSGWCGFTGQDPAEYLAGDYTSLFHPDDGPRVLEAWNAAVQTESMYDVEYRLRHADGTYHTVHSVGIPWRDAGGRIVEWIGTITDVSERRRVEEQLQRLQRSEMVGRLAGGVAHETNNQMTIVLNFLECVRAGGLTPNQLSDLQEIEHAAQRTADLTRQLLAFSRRQVLQPEVLDIAAAVRADLALLERVLGPEIRILVEGDQKACYARLDRTQLAQIVINLAVNARDAMPGGGTLTIGTYRLAGAPWPGRLGVRWQPGAPVNVLAISDTGTGMDAATQSRAFEPFFTTKPVGQGTGLGLSVVEGIVAQSGGDLSLESDVAVGTTVCLFFPAAEPPEEVAAVGSAAVSAPAGRGELILVVDDEEAVRTLMTRELSRHGYHVLAAKDGVEARSLLEREGPRVEVVVTDLSMPNLGGLELAEWGHARWPRLPFLVTSGRPSGTPPASPPGTPPMRFVAKPFMPGALPAAVDEILAAARGTGAS
jgi:two-component system cell cycle sensor histidine kinase/response regulator CckA